MKTFLNNIIDTLPVGIIIVDPLEHCILEINPHAAKLFGASREAVVGKVCHAVICPAEVGKCPITDLGKTVDHAERVLLTHDGGQIPVLKSVSSVVENGRRILVESFLDLRDQKQAEELRVARDAAVHASLAKSQFLANMSHELRTPLNAIIGYSELLQEESVDSGTQNILPDLSKIEVASKHLLALINDILDLSKIEAGKMQLNSENFEVEALINDVVSTMTLMAEKNGNRIMVECPGRIGRVCADEGKVRQVLMNLLSNAIKFTNEGKIWVRTERRVGPQHDWLDLCVGDTGIGMTEEQMSGLFQAFMQVDSSTTRKFAGTGLGLAIARRICQMMGGDLTVESRPDEGTKFHATLAVDPVDQPLDFNPSRKLSLRPEAAPIALDANRRTVLVIDDDPVVCELLTRFLTREGFEIVSCSNGTDGIALARKLRPHAITLDVLMEGLNGWDVLAGLKADPDLASIPVVVISIVDDKNRGFALGAADYITKPIHPGRLTEILHRCRCDNPGTVLVIEDDEASLQLLRHQLQRRSWTVREARNGREGLDEVSKFTPSLILLDLMMPEMDGFEFMTHLRANDAWRSIPVVVLTAMELTTSNRRQLSEQVTKIANKASTSLPSLMSELMRTFPSAEGLVRS